MLSDLNTFCTGMTVIVKAVQNFLLYSHSTCSFPTTSTDLLSMNPSSVMQQMARLASSSAAPVQQFDTSGAAYRDMLQTTAPAFISNGVPLQIFSGMLIIIFDFICFFS